MSFSIWLSVVNWEWLQGVSNRLISDGAPESNGTTLRNVGLLIGGVLALVFALWRSLIAGHQADTSRQQAEVAQQGLLNERYQKGAEMLGSDILSVRLGGIYALQDLSNEFPDQYHLRVMNLLCAFVRHPTPDTSVVSERGGDGKTNEREPTLREDVQTIMEIIGDRPKTQIHLERTGNFRLNLRGANISHVILWSADLSRAELSGANLSRSSLRDVDLSRSRLLGADLSEALLWDANFLGADLLETDLTNADLSSTNLSSARLWGADLRGAILHYSELTDALLSIPSPADSPNVSVLNLTQIQFDEACAKPGGSPTMLINIIDVDTGMPLKWRGKSLEEE